MPHHSKGTTLSNLDQRTTDIQEMLVKKVMITVNGHAEK